MWASVVGSEEGTNHKLARLNEPDLRANLLDHSAVLAAHGSRLFDGTDAAVAPQVRSAHTSRSQANESICWPSDLRIGDIFETVVAGPVQLRSTHR